MHLRASIKDLFTQERKGTTIKLALMWFSLAFVYYAIMFELPNILQKMNQERAIKMEKDEIFKSIAF